MCVCEFSFLELVAIMYLMCVCVNCLELVALPD